MKFSGHTGLTWLFSGVRKRATPAVARPLELKVRHCLQLPTEIPKNWHHSWQVQVTQTRRPNRTFDIRVENGPAIQARICAAANLYRDRSICSVVMIVVALIGLFVDQCHSKGLTCVITGGWSAQRGSRPVD
jgi:hypothetical protein